MAILNLANTEFAKASLWQGLLSADELYYNGNVLDKVQSFKTVKSGEPGAFLIAHVIRRDEDFIWEAARDLVDRAVKQAATMARGVYSFELLSFESDKELQTFNYNELAQVLVNNARLLTPGDQVLVKYSSVYGCLQKVGDESWGKIVFKTSVGLAADKPKFLFVLLAKMLKLASTQVCPVIILLNDFSVAPLFEPHNSEEQQLLFEAFLAKCAKNTALLNWEIYIRDVTGIKRIYGQ